MWGSTQSFEVIYRQIFHKLELGAGLQARRGVSVPGPLLALPDVWQARKGVFFAQKGFDSAEFGGPFGVGVHAVSACREFSLQRRYPDVVHECAQSDDRSRVSR